MIWIMPCECEILAVQSQRINAAGILANHRLRILVSGLVKGQRI
jgi:hypothetical protein